MRERQRGGGRSPRLCESFGAAQKTRDGTERDRDRDRDRMREVLKERGEGRREEVILVLGYVKVLVGHKRLETRQGNVVHSWLDNTTDHRQTK